MKKRWKVLIVLGGVFAAGLGYAAWYGFRNGGPLPSRASLRKQWGEVSLAYMPAPKLGEPDAWEVFAEATEARRDVDRELWSPDAQNKRPVPDFAWLGDAAPVARSSEEWDQEEWKMQLAEKALAERCLAEYRSSGVIAKIDSLAGISAGRSPDIVPPDPEALVGTLKPHLKEMRAFARINGARMRLALEAGDLDEFIRALRTNMTLARMAATGTTLIDRLVGIAIEALTHYAAFTAVQKRADERWFAAVEAEIERGVATVPFAHAIHGERVWGVDALLFAKAIGSFGPQRVGIDAYAAVTGTPPVGSPGENVAELESYYAVFEKLGAIPRHERASRAPDAVKLFGTKPRFRLVQLLVPAVSKSLDADDQLAMKRMALRLSIAVERYRLKHGKLPESLDALDPAVTRDAVDLWSGAPIRYRLATADDNMPCGYVLYSVGYDKTDQNGKRKPGANMYEALSAKGAGFDFVLNGPD